MLTILVVVLFVLLGSALCAASETALLSVPPIKVRQLAQSKTSTALALQGIRQKINRPIATLVILNNVFNIVGSIILGSLAAEVFGDALLGVFSGVLTFLIIVFGEIIPKTVGEQYAIPIALAIAIPVQWITVIFSPLVWFFEKVTAPFTQGQQLPVTNEAEIQLLTRLGRQEGAIEEDEAEMIQRVFQLNDLTASKLMTPRIILTYIPGSSTLGEAKETILSSQHTRIVTIEDTLDRVVGIALKDELLAALITGQGDRQIAELTRPVQFVPETIKADRLLKLFQETREHLAVVLDEYGGVSGVVTLEDVIEVLTGEIVDETDRNVNLQQVARKKRERLLRSMGFQDENHE